MQNDKSGQTYASAGYNDFPTFSLNNGALIPNADNPKVQAVDDAPIDGAMIRFTGSNDGSPLKAGAQVYCVSVSDALPVLLSFISQNVYASCCLTTTTLFSL